MKAIETRELHKAYAKQSIVKGIDLIVHKGEIFGFLGRNGAGKSTFINMLTGIIRPTSGEYALLGVQGPSEEVKKRIGVMPDYTTFYGSMNAVDHLIYLSALSGNPQSKERCLEVLHAVGLESHAFKKAGKYSFGMKKKLGIAQAIIHDPELIFLDEPTSGMDPESVIEIHKLIEHLQKEKKTIFMTSHNLYEVEKICTRIAIMKDGSLVSIGSMEELRAHYRSSLTVKLKHAPVPFAEQAVLQQWLEANGTNLEVHPTNIVITLESEKKIAEMIRAVQRSKSEVYRVEVDEPSLEDIFLNE